MDQNSPKTAPVICPHCGSLQETDPGREYAFCVSCGKRYSPPDGALAFLRKYPGGAFPSGAYFPASGQLPPQPPKPKRRKGRALLWVLLILAALGCLAPRAYTLYRQLRLRAAPVYRMSDLPSAPAATSRPGSAATPAATPKPTVKPTATPRPTPVRPSPSPRATPTPAPAQVSPEFRELMDRYEVFFDEYITFLGEMEENSGSLTWLLRYSEMLGRYTEAMEALDAIDPEALSPADYTYYLEVMTRIEVKLLSVLGN